MYLNFLLSMVLLTALATLILLLYVHVLIFVGENFKGWKKHACALLAFIVFSVLATLILFEVIREIKNFREEPMLETASIFLAYGLIFLPGMYYLARNVKKLRKYGFFLQRGQKR